MSDTTPSYRDLAERVEREVAEAAQQQARQSLNLLWFEIEASHGPVVASLAVQHAGRKVNVDADREFADLPEYIPSDRVGKAMLARRTTEAVPA